MELKWRKTQVSYGYCEVQPRDGLAGRVSRKSSYLASTILEYEE